MALALGLVSVGLVGTIAAAEARSARIEQSRKVEDSIRQLQNDDGMPVRRDEFNLRPEVFSGRLRPVSVEPWFGGEQRVCYRSEVTGQKVYSRGRLGNDPDFGQGEWLS